MEHKLLIAVKKHLLSPKTRNEHAIPMMLSANMAIVLFVAACAWAHDEHPAQRVAETTNVALVQVQSLPGENAWNAGKPPSDWWAEIKRQHGHVGPWNVVGWRIGQAALRECGSQWGRHELEIICYVPPQTPFACMLDGLAVGTGNSLGRMDLRLAEVFSSDQVFVAVRRKDKKGGVMEFRPNPHYLKSITNRQVEELEALSRQCGEMEEKQIFTARRLPS